MYESGATRSGRRGQVRETARLSQTKKSFRLRPLSGNGKKKIFDSNWVDRPQWFRN